METLLLSFCIQEHLMDLITLREKPNRLNQHVIFATRGKLSWFECTLAAQLIALQRGNFSLGCDCIGLYTVENHIGNIRSNCHGDNQAVTVERQVSRIELMSHLLQDLCIERHITGRVNLGGLSLSSGSELDFQLDENLSDFAIELLLTAKSPLLEVYRLHRGPILPLEPSTHLCRSFLKQINVFMLAAPLAQNLAPVRSSTQGGQIVSRLHAFGSARHEEDHSDDEPPLEGEAAGRVDPDLVSRRHWTLGELEQFSHMIIEGQTTIGRLT
jgi:hypothetical protein